MSSLVCWLACVLPSCSLRLTLRLTLATHGKISLLYLYYAYYLSFSLWQRARLCSVSGKHRHLHLVVLGVDGWKYQINVNNTHSSSIIPGMFLAYVRRLSAAAKQD